jgi:hypothetical protein
MTTQMAKAEVMPAGLLQTDVFPTNGELGYITMTCRANGLCRNHNIGIGDGDKAYFCDNICIPALGRLYRDSTVITVTKDKTGLNIYKPKV